MTCWSFASTFQLREGGGGMNQGSACSVGWHMGAARNPPTASFWCQPLLSGDLVAVLLRGGGEL